MLLLLLRCVAMALIGLLLARPFFSQESGARLFAGSRHDRVIVLDDSLSMKALGGGATPFDAARTLLDEWVSGLASRGSDDAITVIRVSDPSKPLFNAVPLSEASVSEILRELSEMQASDVPAGLAVALGEVEKLLEDPTRGGGVNRIVYVLTDMRRKDWEGEPAAEGAEPTGEKDAVATLKRIASRAAGCYVMDLGTEGEANLAIEEIVPGDKALIAGVATEFEVVVRNLGREVANDVGIRFSAADALPLESTIDRIEPGETGAVAFSYTFAAPDAAPGLPEPVVLKAEILVGDGAGDLLADDNTRYFAARVSRGLRVLVVDGDPSGAFGGSESYFLGKALAPRGSVRSGLEVTVVDDAEFDETRLDAFQVVFLANLYRVTEERRKKLEDWVSGGGGLVVGLGDQVDEAVYNEELFAEGAGVLPARLDTIAGDETEETWVYFEPVKENHPVLRLFEGNSNPLLEAVKIFRWWRLVPDEAAEKAGRSTVLARLTDEEKSPAFIEGRFGEGNVMLVATSLDVDWNNWAEDGASYLIVMQELARYMARSNAREGDIATGQVLVHAIDLAEFRPEAAVVGPSGRKSPVQAQRPAGEGTGDAAGTRWEITFDDTRERGFHRLRLTPTDGGEERSVLFAANMDSGEGRLARVDTAGMEAELGEGGVRLVREKESVFDLGAVTGKTEFWKLVLYVLAAILCVELAFAWWLGAKRGQA